MPMDHSFLVAVVLHSEPLHVFKCDLAFVVPVEDALVAGDISGSRVELLVHGAIEVHQHLPCCDRLQNAILVIVVHLKNLSSYGW